MQCSGCSRDLRSNALIFASENGYKEAIQLLLASGAQVNKSDRCERTALSLDEDKNNREVAALLRQHGETKSRVKDVLAHL